MHQGTGHDMIFYRGWGSATANLLTTQSMAPRATALLSCGGVLERFPDLHVVMVEVNAGWMGWTMSTLDEYYLAHQESAGRSPSSPSCRVTTCAARCTRPSRTTRSRCTTSRFTGTDCLMWGNDYPHPESTYPELEQGPRRLLVDVDDDVAHAVVFDNAARIFGFSPGVREPVS